MSDSRLFNSKASATAQEPTLVNITLLGGGGNDTEGYALKSSFKNCSYGFDIVHEAMSREVNTLNAKLDSLNAKRLPYQITFIGRLKGASVNETFNNLDSFKEYLINNVDNALFNTSRLELK
jgi:hypothetical protein